MVGAAAMRQAAEDVSAHSAVKEVWNEEDEELNEEKALRKAVEREVTRFPENERQQITEAVMKAFENGDFEVGWDTARLVQAMRRLRELPVAASAVKFCSNLFREATRVDPRAGKKSQNWEEIAEQEADKAAGICHKVLTGELGPHDGPKWAEKAANSSQPKGQHYQLGRLQKVNATEKAWKVSLKNVCKDECIELVKEMKEAAWHYSNEFRPNGKKKKENGGVVVASLNCRGLAENSKS